MGNSCSDFFFLTCASVHENKAVAWSEIHWEDMLGENPPEFL